MLVNLNPMIRQCRHYDKGQSQLAPVQLCLANNLYYATLPRAVVPEPGKQVLQLRHVTK